MNQDKAQAESAETAVWTVTAARSMSRRRIAGRVALALPPAVLAACTGRSDSGAAAPAAAGPPAPVTFFWRGPGATPYQHQAEEKARLFNEREATYKVEIAYQDGKYPEKLTAMFAAGDPPSTFWADHGRIIAFLKQGFLDDLTPLAKGDRSYRAADYHAASTDSLTIDGKLYGLAGASFTGGLFYNKALFARAGTPTPAELLQQGKWTWESALDAARRITALGTTGAGARILGFGDVALTRLWLNSTGTQEVDHLKFPTRSGYDSPGAVQAIEFWTDVLLKHQLRDPELGRGVQGGETALFTNGQLGMVARWTTGLSELVNVRDFAWGMVPYPKGPQGAKPAGDFTFWGFGAARGLKDERVRRGAWEWLKFYNGREGQEIEGGKYLLSIPYDKTALEAWRKQLATTRVEYPELILDVRDKYGNQRVMAPDEARIEELHNAALAAARTGRTSVREACAEAARQVNEFLKLNPQKVIGA